MKIDAALKRYFLFFKCLNTNTIKNMSDLKKKHRYKHVEGKRWIEVRVRSPHQLFDARDPAPFRERDLDDDFVAYIVASLRELPAKTPLKIVIYVEEKESVALSKDSIREAIHSYFAYEADLHASELRSFLRRAQVFFLIGLVLLGVCVGLVQNVDFPSLPGPLSVLREGLLIFGWVSLWKPIELILFDWYPLYDKVKLFRRIISSEVDVHFGKSTA